MGSTNTASNVRLYEKPRDFARAHVDSLPEVVSSNLKLCRSPLDSALCYVDLLPKISSDEASQLQRSDRALTLLRENFNMPGNSRLAFRPEPWCDPEHSSQTEDRSFYYFWRDVNRGFDRGSPIGEVVSHYWWALGPSAYFMTHLDAIACLDLDGVLTTDGNSTEIEACVNFLRSVAPVIGACTYQATYQAGDDPSNAIKNCTKLLLLKRFRLFEARSEGLNATVLRSRLERTERNFGAPKEWDLHIELLRLEAEILRNIWQVEAEFGCSIYEIEEDIDCTCGDRVFGDCSIDSCTTPIPTSSSDTQCNICREPVSNHGVLTRDCNHTYCHDCLEAWITCSEPMSNTCPTCRQELFEFEDYIDPKCRYYDERFDDIPPWLSYLTNVRNMIGSLEWFEKELELEDSVQRAQEGF
jgi:hypothetical protein